MNTTLSPDELLTILQNRRCNNELAALIIDSHYIDWTPRHFTSWIGHCIYYTHEFDNDPRCLANIPEARALLANYVARYPAFLALLQTATLSGGLAEMLVTLCATSTSNVAAPQFVQVNIDARKVTEYLDKAQAVLATHTDSTVAELWIDHAQRVLKQWLPK